MITQLHEFCQLLHDLRQLYSATVLVPLNEVYSACSVSNESNSETAFVEIIHANNVKRPWHVELNGKVSPIICLHYIQIMSERIVSEVFNSDIAGCATLRGIISVTLKIAKNCSSVQIGRSLINEHNAVFKHFISSLCDDDKRWLDAVLRYGKADVDHPRTWFRTEEAQDIATITSRIFDQDPRDIVVTLEHAITRAGRANLNLDALDRPQWYVKQGRWMCW